MPVAPVKAADGAEEAKAVDPKSVTELTLAERKKLRMMRFKSGGAEGNTIDALEQMQEQKDKINARAQRFGIVTKDMADDRIKER